MVQNESSGEADIKPDHSSHTADTRRPQKGDHKVQEYDQEAVRGQSDHAAIYQPAWFVQSPQQSLTFT
jgi:hypothetical protein